MEKDLVVVLEVVLISGLALAVDLSFLKFAARSFEVDGRLPAHPRCQLGLPNR